MKNNKLLSALVIACAVSFASVSVSGCASGSTETVSTQVSATNANQVKKALLEALHERDFTTKIVSDGVIEATYARGDHSVTVNVLYTANNFDIVYVTSTNLKAENGKIHRNYNRWINNVRKDTQKLLNKAQ